MSEPTRALSAPCGLLHAHKTRTVGTEERTGWLSQRLTSAILWMERTERTQKRTIEGQSPVVLHAIFLMASPGRTTPALTTRT